MLANGAPICYKKRRYCLFGGPAMKNSCQRTIYACYAGYVVQAVVNNFVPLLFVMFERSYQIPLSRITLLITVNFCIQLGVDLLSTWFLDRIGYRAAILLSHVLLTILPDVFPDPAAGLTAAVAVYALGGGLLEVLISPIMESCPTDNKERYMSLLHSFYCWGHMAVVLLSTAFFAVFGIEKWKIMALLWALVPLANGIFFAGAPLYPIQSGETGALPLRELCRKKLFWVFMLMMLCAGAAEQAVSQWASALAEKGFGFSKTVGDLAGPMAFAAAMGISRALFGRYGGKLDLGRYMQASALLCIAAYGCIVFVPSPVLSLIGCAVTGFSVGIFWPGTFSRAAASIRGGGTAMFGLSVGILWPGTFSIAAKEIRAGGTALFALLALAGDLGCAGGPTLAGLVSSACGGSLRAGILAALIFPALMLVCLLGMRKTQ